MLKLDLDFELKSENDDYLGTFLCSKHIYNLVSYFFFVGAVLHVVLIGYAISSVISYLYNL